MRTLLVVMLLVLAGCNLPLEGAKYTEQTTVTGNITDGVYQVDCVVVNNTRDCTWTKLNNTTDGQ